MLLITFFAVNFSNAQIPTNGLKVYFPFNKNSNDESGNVQHGTNYNVTLSKDRFNKDSSAYYFNGSTNSYIEIPVNSLLNNTYTYSLWTKLKTFPSNDAMSFILNVGGAGGDNSLGICNNYTQAAYHGWAGGGYNTIAPNFGLTDKNFSLDYNWNHIVCVRSSKYALLYVNGILVDSIGGNSVSYPSYGNNSKAYIGIRNNYVTPYNGWIDDVAIYDRALSKSEVMKLYNYNPTEIELISINPKSIVFPNPNNKGSFNITTLNFDLNNFTIKIYNSIGQIQNFESKTIDDSNLQINHQLAKGVYFIIISDKNQETTKTTLIVD